MASPKSLDRNRSSSIMTTNIFILVLAASLLHAIWNFSVRKTSGNMVVLWSGLWMACLLLLPVAIFCLTQIESPGESLMNSIACTIATGIVHAIYFFLLGRAYHLGEISLVYPIAKGSGVALTALIAWIVLQEKFSTPGLAGMILICTGVLSLSRSANPSSGNSRSVFLALGIGISIAAYSIVDKVGVSLVDPVIYIWIMFFLSAVLLTPYIRIHYPGGVINEVRGKVKYTVIIGAGSMITYLMILFAFRQGPVGYIVAIREVAVVAGALLGILLLNERVTPLKLAAIGFIVTGTILIRVSE